MFLQCIMRQLESMHLKTAYENDQPTGLRLQVRQLMALPFAPLALVRNTFNIFQATALPQLVPLFQYFDDQWLTSTPLAMWNTHTATIRTTNDVEGTMMH
jgi:hypothetical protein